MSHLVCLSFCHSLRSWRIALVMFWSLRRPCGISHPVGAHRVRFSKLSSPEHYYSLRTILGWRVPFSTQRRTSQLCGCSRPVHEPDLKVDHRSPPPIPRRSDTTCNTMNATQISETRNPFISLYLRNRVSPNDRAVGQSRIHSGPGLQPWNLHS